MRLTVQHWTTGVTWLKRKESWKINQLEWSQTCQRLGWRPSFSSRASSSVSLLIHRLNGFENKKIKEKKNKIKPFEVLLFCHMSHPQREPASTSEGWKGETSPFLAPTATPGQTASTCVGVRANATRTEWSRRIQDRWQSRGGSVCRTGETSWRWTSSGSSYLTRGCTFVEWKGWVSTPSSRYIWQSRKVREVKVAWRISGSPQCWSFLSSIYSCFDMLPPLCYVDARRTKLICFRNK